MHGIFSHERPPYEKDNGAHILHPAARRDHILQRLQHIRKACRPSAIFIGRNNNGRPSTPPALPPPVTALKGWELNGSNTGLAGDGIDRSTLPLYEPPADQVQYGTWTVPADTVITEQRIEMGGIDISAGNITFERCWFHPSSIGRGMPLFRGTGASLNSNPGCDIDGSAIPLNGDGTNPACGSIAISCANIRVLLCNISGLASGVAFNGENPVTMEGTYIHDLVQGEWFLGSGQSTRTDLPCETTPGPWPWSGTIIS